MSVVELLPLRTELPREPQKHRHHPPKSSYKHYRACLRWDFGFTCPFCMLHEGDIAEDGVERRHDVGIEHFQRRESSPHLVDLYENCLLSCTLCNEDRGTRPNTDKHGRDLLDPSRAAWDEHFVWQDGDQLRPKPGDGDAEYTFCAYKLNHPKKLESRRRRRDLIRTSLLLVEDLTTLITKLNKKARAAQGTGDFERARKQLREAHRRQQALAIVVKQLQRFSAVPRDRPTRCRCSHGADMTLPAWLAQQTTAVSLPDVPEQ